jgi:hypothetical protein
MELKRMGGRHSRKWMAAVSMAALVSGLTWQPQASADPLDPLPTKDTATGQYRTGLARVGLVKLESLTNARVFLASGSGDSSPKLDVRVDVLNNNTPVASGLVRCQAPLTASPSALTVPFDAFTPPTLAPGDVLSMRVSVRLGTNADDTKCASNGKYPGVKLLYDSTGTPSQLGATITTGPALTLYAHSNGGACGAGGSTGVTAQSLTEVAPTASTAKCSVSGQLDFKAGNPWSTAGSFALGAQLDYAEAYLPEVRNSPAAPAPEPVSLKRLPTPPIAPSNTAGSCSLSVNPHGTGCISGLGQLGGYIDANHVVGNVTFAGAPAGGIYTGDQLIIVKTDGTTFSNGDTWKCVTCGIPAGNRQSINGPTDYPQPFNDGERILRGTNIIDCSPHQLIDDTCTPNETHIYPIVWNIGSTTGIIQRMRELRIHPDDMHLGWNAYASQPGGSITEFGLLGLLTFNPAPTSGTPLVPRYDMSNVSWLINTTDPLLNERSISVNPANPSQLMFIPPAAHIGEFRGFTSSGSEALGIGTEDSCNWDPWATNLQTGKSRRLGRNPNYMDPMNSSPDDNWTIMADGRTDNRMAFLGALPGVPPVIDNVGCALQGIYNNGDRRFFEPWLIDRYGDRGSYNGQKINAGFDPTPGSGSLSDPLWNTRADPQFSPIGTSIAYYEIMVTPPACGGANPIVCPVSKEPGGFTTRWILASLTSRSPISAPPVIPISDNVPWGIPYFPGNPLPARSYIPGGTYTLPGKVYGSATAVITQNATQTGIDSIEVTFTNYSDDGINVVNGSSSRTASGIYHENLTLSGGHTGNRVTTEPGGWVFSGATRAGTLSTTIDGVTYTSPPSNQ